MAARADADAANRKLRALEVRKAHGPGASVAMHDPKMPPSPIPSCPLDRARLMAMSASWTASSMQSRNSKHRCAAVGAGICRQFGAWRGMELDGSCDGSVGLAACSQCTAIMPSACLQIAHRDQQLATAQSIIDEKDDKSLQKRLGKVRQKALGCHALRHQGSCRAASPAACPANTSSARSKCMFNFRSSFCGAYAPACPSLLVVNVWSNMVAARRLSTRPITSGRSWPPSSVTWQHPSVKMRN